MNWGLLTRHKTLQQHQKTVKSFAVTLFVLGGKRKGAGQLIFLQVNKEEV